MNQVLPFNYQNLPNQTQTQTQGQPFYGYGQTPDYKPFGIEKLSQIMGQVFLLTQLENINTIPLPRGNDQQIFLVNNDEKIYIRQSDNSIGIIGYRQDYVQKISQELTQAQAQLQEIFQEALKQENQTTPATPEQPQQNASEDRINALENKIDQLFSLLQTKDVKETKKNEPAKNDKALAAISELA